MRASSRRQRNWRFILGNTVSLAVTVVIASTTLWPVYQSSAFVVMVIATIILGSTIAIIGAIFRWPSWAMMLSTVGIFLVAGVPLAVPGQSITGVLPSAAGLGELMVSSVLGWKQLVTIVLPVGDYQALLVPAFIMVLLATVIGLSTALRARTSELAVLAPIALFVGGIALGPAVPSAPIELGIGIFVSVLSWLLWLRWYRRRDSIRLVGAQAPVSSESAFDRRMNAMRGLASAAIIVAIAIAAGTAAAIAAPASVPRDVARARVQQPFDPRDYTSPLSEFRGYLQADVRDAELLRVTGLPDSGRLRLAALDTYDGIVFSVGNGNHDSSSNSFTRLPFRLDQSGVDGEGVSISVQVDGYSGVWVPGTGALERITFTGDTSTARNDAFFYNDNSSTGAVLGGLRQGDSYTAQSVVPREIDTLDSLLPGNAVLPPMDVVPDELTQTLARWVSESDPAGEQLASMLANLRSEGYISHGIDPDEPTSRSGHGADRITQLLTDRPMVGDAEQYAVTAALMARTIGFPARVVMGFIPQANSTAVGGAATVTGSDVSAWIEVQESGGSWVTVDPNPDVRDIPEKQPDAPTEVSRPQSVVPPPLEEPKSPEIPAQPESSEQEPAPTPNQFLAILGTVLKIAGWSVLALTLLLSPFIAIIVGKLRRRKLRSHAATPEERIAGGWREFADRVVDTGVDVPVAATRTEFAEHVGGMRPLVLASFVDRAVFAPGEPSVDDADRVWKAVGELDDEMTAKLNRRQRITALVSLRSFGRYAGRAAQGGQQA
ncbi:transglutaminase domain-containing protein [Leifsonia sp. A12D58]|uniref:transglutaminase domain-containing protein n=1 Tax=Leifsonia sp. A12D58 TaxID=3397674 RepID=UPI0039E02FB0